VTGLIGLHGGGEYLPGDEPFLEALIERARGAAAEAERDVAGHALPAHVGGGGPAAGSVASSRPIRIVVVPTAAARGRPDLAASNGRRAFERVAARTPSGVDVEVRVARVVDASSAADPAFADALARADLIHLPGGDPDLIPTVLGGTPALAAIESAWRRGALLAGASAGAMALAEWTWTPRGGLRGLGLVRGLAVVPHYDDIRRLRWQEALDELAPGGLGYLGLDERTGVIGRPTGNGGADWTVVGEGSAWWFARGAAKPVVGRAGDRITLPS
jgi:cyanophycinase-like exopeptidase